MTKQGPDKPQGGKDKHHLDNDQVQQAQPQGWRDAEQLNPRNDRGQGSERSQAQGRGNDPDRG